MLESERIWWLQTATTGVLEYYIELSSPSWTVKFRAGILYRTLTWVCGVETRTRVSDALLGLCVGAGVAKRTHHR
jgi:hypothetical protein